MTPDVTKYKRIRNTATTTITRPRHDQIHTKPRLPGRYWISVKGVLNTRNYTGGQPAYFKDSRRTKTARDRTFGSSAPLLWNRQPNQVSERARLSSFNSDLNSRLFKKEYLCFCITLFVYPLYCLFLFLVFDIR